MIESDSKSPPTYDYPGQATPGYKTHLDPKPKASPTPAPVRKQNPPMNYFREDDGQK